MKIKTVYLLFLILNLLINLFLYLYEQVTGDLSYHILSGYSTLLIFFAIGFSIYLTKNLFSLLTIFSSLYLLFLYGSIILHFFSPSEDIFTLHLITDTFIGVHFITLATIISNIAIITIHLFFIIGYKEYINSNKFENAESINSKNIFRVFKVFAILASVKLILEAIYIAKVGYVTIYINGLEGVNYYSPIIKYSPLFLLVFYGIILQHVPTKRRFIFCAIAITITAFFDSLKGARVLFLIPILFSFWYYSRFYSKNNPLKQIRNNLVIISLIFVVLISLKLKRNNDLLKIENPFAEIKYVLEETGSTLKIVALYAKSKNKILEDYPFVLEPIFYPYFYARYNAVMTSGQSKELVDRRNSLNHRLTYYTFPDSYLNGSGLGSSMVAEAYQYGLLYLILISALFGIYIRIIENNMIKDSPFLLLSPVLISTIIFAPRDSPFPNTWGIIKFLLIFIVYYLLIAFIGSLKKQLKNNNKI